MSMGGGVWISVMHSRRGLIFSAHMRRGGVGVVFFGSHRLNFPDSTPPPLTRINTRSLTDTLYFISTRHFTCMHFLHILQYISIYIYTHSFHSYNNNNNYNRFILDSHNVYQSAFSCGVKPILPLWFVK